MAFLRFNHWLSELAESSGPISAVFFEEVRAHVADARGGDRSKNVGPVSFGQSQKEAARAAGSVANVPAERFAAPRLTQTKSPPSCPGGFYLRALL